MKSVAWVLIGLLFATVLPARAAAPPDYSTWGGLLAKYYDPAKGMNYGALKANDKAALDALRQRLAQVDLQFLSRNDQLAYWINLYNILVVGVVVDHYPVASIRDLSTDPVVRLNIFKKDLVETKRGKVSLNDIENEKIRNGFKDPRIHFAINCAAKSCPPIRTEPFVGDKIGPQLDDQVRKFLAGPLGVKADKKGSQLTLRVTKIFDWFSGDFDRWGGGAVEFLRRYVPPVTRNEMDASGNQIRLAYDDYDWALNDAKM